MASRSRASRDSDDFDDRDESDSEGEGPSSEDLARFSGEEGICPECGAEIWDDASVCPRCGAIVDGEVTKRSPIDAWWRNRWITLIVIMLVLVLLGLLPILLRRGR